MCTIVYIMEYIIYVYMLCIFNLINTLNVFVLAEIFSSSQRNGILQTKPSVIHFDGYQVGQVHHQTLVSVGL